MVIKYVCKYLKFNGINYECPYRPINNIIGIIPNNDGYTMPIERCPSDIRRQEGGLRTCWVVEDLKPGEEHPILKAKC